MANQVVDNKFTWVIKNFSSSHLKFVISDTFVICGCSWNCLAYPKGSPDHMVMHLFPTDSKSLSSEWQRHAQVSITVVNQTRGKLSQQPELKWFKEKERTCGFKCLVNLAEIKAKDSGFLVNGELKIAAEVNVHEDVPEEFEEVTQPLKKKKTNDDGTAVSKETLAEWVDVNGFRVLPSQVESVKRIFEKHPDIAVKFQAKNLHLRTACMFSLLGLIETLCKSVKELARDDLVEADNALIHLKHSGFKVDWLEEKLEKVKEKKMDEMVIQIYEEELKGIKQKCSEKEALIKKEKEELKDLKQKYSVVEGTLKEKKAEVLAFVTTPLTLDDVL